MDKREKKKPIIKKAIADAFPKTEDAVLVQTHLGHTIKDNTLFGLLIKPHAAALLARAKELQAAENKKEDTE